MGRAPKKVKWLEKCHKTYYDPKQPGSFSGVKGIQRVTGYKAGKIKNWLSKQDSYTLHKPAYRKFPRRRVFIPDMGYQWIADLVDVTSLKQENDNHTFLLTVINGFSRKAACEPLLRKTGACVAKAFKKIINESNLTTPKKLQTDKGSEFYNKEVKPLLKKHNIELFSTENDDIKGGIIERFNRTLKSRMWKYFTAERTHRYLDVLQHLIDSYNNTYHSSIKMKPSDVNTENEHEVWNNLYGKYRKPTKPKFRIGDYVRISKTSRPFKKGYLPNWSEEIFTVASIVKSVPVTYRIKEENGTFIKGTFYEKELQKTQRKRVFEIEHVLDRRIFRGRPQTLVKWKGYPTSYNQWVYDRDMRKMKNHSS